MKKQLLIALVIVGAFVLVGAPAVAQTTSKVNIPFEFIVGDTVLPAGAYSVSRPADGKDVATVRSADGRLVATAIVQPTGQLASGVHPTFAFQKIGGRYFLATVNVPGFEGRALLLPKSHVAAMLAKLNGTKVHTGPAL